MDIGKSPANKRPWRRLVCRRVAAALGFWSLRHLAMASVAARWRVVCCETTRYFVCVSMSRVQRGSFYVKKLLGLRERTRPLSSVQGFPELIIFDDFHMTIPICLPSCIGGAVVCGRAVLGANLLEYWAGRGVGSATEWQKQA